MNTNQFIVTGNLGVDPELYKKSEESKGVVSFTLAENVARLNEKTGKYEQAHTNWFPIKVLGSLGARVRAGLKKGDRVTVFGKLRTYQYEDEAGSVRCGFEVLADSVSPSSILAKVDSDETDFSEFKKGM